MNNRSSYMRCFLNRFGFAILVIVLVVVIEILPGPRSVDDAFITFRYARNLAAGHGFVYNPGEHVLGTTTPLYTLGLSAFSLVTLNRDYPWLALIINAVCDVATILLLKRLIRALGQPELISLSITLTYLFNPLRIGVALGGMETSLMILWLVAASEAYVTRNRKWQAAVFSGLAVLTRPDAILLPILLALHQLFFERRLPWREAVIFLMTTGTWIVFALIYFGSPLPNSILAKSHAYFLHPSQALATLLGFIATRSPLNGANWPLWSVGLSLGLVLSCYIMGARNSIRIQSRALPLVAFAPLYFVGLSAGNPLLFFWYYPPLILGLDLFSLIGISSLFRQTPLAVRTGIISLCAISILSVQWIGLRSFVQNWPIDLRQREFVYEDSAKLLDDTIAPGSVVAMPEIGVFGYVLDRDVIIDTLGIITPQAIPYLMQAPALDQTINYAVSTEVITALQPEYVISLESFIRSTLLRSPNFLKTYDLIREFDTSEFDSHGLLVFRRKSN